VVERSHLACGLCGGQTPCALVFSGFFRFLVLSSFQQFAHQHPFGLSHNCLKTLNKIQIQNSRVLDNVNCQNITDFGVVKVSKITVGYYGWIAETVTTLGN